MASLANSPVMIFLFCHKAIRSELDWLHYAITTFLTDSHRDTNPLFERYCFLRTIYQHHCNAEDKCRLKKQKDSLTPEKQEYGEKFIWTSGLIFWKRSGIGYLCLEGTE